jgi:hypothetical protein
MALPSAFMRTTLKISLALTAIGIAATLVLSYSGFCFRQGRYIPDEELIASGIGYLLSIRSFNIYEPHFALAQFTREYASAEEFVRLNPECCNVTLHARKGLDVPFLNKLLGRTRAYVHVRHQAIFREADGSLHEATTDRFVAISNCGNVWNED